MLTVRASVKLVWLVSAYALHVLSIAVAWVTIIEAVIKPHIPEGYELPEDWSTLLLGLYTADWSPFIVAICTTFVIHVVFGKLEEHSGTPLFRFTVASAIATTSVAAVVNPNIRWSDCFCSARINY